jgi:hypothetical protein
MAFSLFIPWRRVTICYLVWSEGWESCCDRSVVAMYEEMNAVVLILSYHLFDVTDELLEKSFCQVCSLYEYNAACEVRGQNFVLCSVADYEF